MKLKVISAYLAVIAVLFAAAPVFAAEFISPSQNTGSVTVGPEEHRNVYSVGGNVNVTGRVAGDLMAAGGSVTVNAPVESDLTASGGTLIVNNPIGGDARLAGGNITINSPINGDLLVGGGNVTVASGATVAGDLVTGTGTLELHAPVRGKVMAAGGNIYINSAITGEVQVRADKLTFGPQAQVTGRIVYKGPQAAEVQDGARVSTVEFTRVENHGKGGAGVAGLLTMWFLISLLAYFIAAWIVNHYYKAHVAAVANAIYSRPMKYLGIGIIALIVTPILSIIVLITFVGYYIAIIALALYVLLLVLSGLFSVIFTGSLIWKWFKKEPQMEFSWRTALVGAIVMALLKLIPFIGWAICAVIMLMAFGALISRLRPRTSPAPEVIV